MNLKKPKKINESTLLNNVNHISFYFIIIIFIIILLLLLFQKCVVIRNIDQKCARFVASIKNVQ